MSSVEKSISISDKIAPKDSEIIFVKPYDDNNNGDLFDKDFILNNSDSESSETKSSSLVNDSSSRIFDATKGYTHYESDSDDEYEPNDRKDNETNSKNNTDQLILNFEDSNEEKKEFQQTAPSFDEVKDDADEGALVASRGEGRYFGFDTSSSPIICKKCGGKGHIAAKCDVVLCENCGAKNEHNSRDCPKTKKCSRCGKLGHIRKDCTGKAISIFCRKCNSRIHTTEHCPSIWRSYIIEKKAKVQYPKLICCYNCGGSGHYGDNCVEPRRVELRFCEDSAFNGILLPPQFKEKYNREVTRLKREHDIARNRALDDYMPRKDRRAMNREREKSLKRTGSSSNLNNSYRENRGFRNDRYGGKNVNDSRDYERRDSYKDNRYRRDDSYSGSKRYRRN